MQKRITIFDTVRGFISRHLARQHQLDIFVYRGLDVHALTQQC